MEITEARRIVAKTVTIAYLEGCVGFGLRLRPIGPSVIFFLSGLCCIDLPPVAQASQQASSGIKSAVSWFQEGQAALAKNDLPAAESDFRHVLKLDPASGAAHANLGVIAMRQGKWDDALAQLHKAEKLAPQMSGVRLNIGLVEYRRANYVEAIAPLEKVVSEQPESTQARYLLGLCYTFVDRFGDAVRVLEPLWPQFSNQFVYLYVLGNSAFRAGDKELDEKASQRLIEIGGDTPEFHLLMGKALLARNDEQKALEEFQKAARNGDNLPFLHFELGVTYWRMTRFDDAVKELLKDIALEPGIGYNYEQLGRVYLQMGREAEAENAFVEALKNEPRLPTALVELAKIHLHNGNLQAAAQESGSAVKLAPKNQNAHFLHGQVLQRLGRGEEAKSEFAEARKIMAAGVERDRGLVDKGTTAEPELAQQP
jgi:tetratricopeptide (TPR) repeat protein